MTRKKRTPPAELVAASGTATLDAERAEAAAAHWRARYKEAAAVALDRAAQVDALTALATPPTPRPIGRPGKRGNPSGVAAVIPATDWHVEERVTRDGTNGKNAFDLAEAERRIHRFYRRAVRLIDWYSRLAPVVEIWHPLLGDLMTGYIHDELQETNTLSPTEACLFLADTLTSGIDFLRRETKLPVIVPTCVGNHGRTTERKRIKTSYRNSYEWLLYQTMARHYAQTPGVEWRVGQGYHNMQEIQGRRVRFHHGDGLRFSGGVGGISIPVNKAVAQWQKVTPADFDVFGHWHTFLWHYPGWVSCPSLIGYTEYSVEIKAEFQHPSQAFIVIDRAYGITLATPIFLTDPKGAK